MTSAVHHSSATEQLPSRNPLLIAIGLGSSALLTAVGTFADLTDNESGSAGTDEIGSWLTCLAIAAVAAAIAFGLVVRTAARGNAGRRSLLTAVVAFLSLAVFWAGLPAVLAAAAVACALVDRDRHEAFGAMAKVGLAVSAIVTALAVMLAIAG